MSDLATKPNVVLPPYINTWTRYMAGLTIRSLNGQNVTPPQPSINWTANYALFVPLWLPWPYPIKRVFVANGTGLRSLVDIGIYTPGGARIFSLGGVAGAGAGGNLDYKSVDWRLDPGGYLFAVSTSDTSSRFQGSALTAPIGRPAGLLQQISGGYPLPASATFAAYDATVGLPIMGFTLLPSGF